MAEDPRWDFEVGPDERAVTYLESKGIRRSWRWPSMWQTEHAYAFTLAGVHRLDVLATAKGLVTQAIAEGQTLEQFRAGFEDRLKGLGFAGEQLVEDFAEGPRKVNLSAPWRTRVIYDTNMRQAYAAAEWQAIEDTQADFPALQYRHTPQAHPRVQHKAWDKIVLPVNHPFWRTNFPPNGWYCKCHTLQVSLDELASGEVKLTTPERLEATGWVEDPARWPEYRHRLTGRVDRAPDGVTPGFAYNAGQDRRSNLGELLARRIDQLDPDMARAASADLTNFPAFADLVGDSVRLGKARADARRQAVARLKGGSATKAQIEAAGREAEEAAGAWPPASWPVGVAPAEIRAPGVGGGVVVANAQAIGHSADLHATTPADWRRVQQLLEAGAAYRTSSGELAIYGQFAAEGGPRTWFLALKPVDGALRVKTFHESSPRRWRAARSRHELVRDVRGDLLLEG